MAAGGAEILQPKPYTPYYAGAGTPRAMQVQLKPYTLCYAGAGTPRAMQVQLKPYTSCYAGAAKTRLAKTLQPEGPYP